MPGLRAIPVIGSLALAAALLVAGVIPDAAAEDAPAGGFEAHVDPQTGELVEAPLAPPRGLAGDQAATTADGSPLRQEMGAAGGVSVELRGALRSTVTATVGPDGQTRTRCDGGHPIRADKVAE
jgi:hypothetical protein